MIKSLASIILMYYLLNCCQCGTLPASQQAEQTLIVSLIPSSYNKNVRPDDQVSVLISASIQQIVAMDEKQQIMTSSLYVTQAWKDDRLSWTPSSNNNINSVMLPVKSLWISDTMILNSADANGYLTVSDYSYASVRYDGVVVMILPAFTAKTKCNLIVQKFPFDRQVCSINITSWSQGNNRLAYVEDNSIVIDTSSYVEHPLWQLISTDMIVSHAEDRAPFEDTYNSVISIQLFLQRKPLFFIMNGIFACLVLNVVTLLAYSLQFGTQVGLCMTCFMTYSVYSLTFSNLFPQQSQYLMMITLYFLLSIAWTAVSMAWFVTCNYYTSKGEMPKPLYIFCGWLQRLCFCCFPSTKPDGKMDKNKDVIVENGELKKSGNQETAGTTSTGKAKCVSCRQLATFCLRKRTAVANADNEQNISVENTESGKTNRKDVQPMETPACMIIHETNEKEKAKCNFCDRCESCQADFDKDKVKGKKKKDIEARCNALNYLVFVCVFLAIFISNMVLWISMAQ